MNPRSGLPCAMVRRSLSCARDRRTALTGHKRWRQHRQGTFGRRPTGSSPSLSRGAAAGRARPGAPRARCAVRGVACAAAARRRRAMAAGRAMPVADRAAAMPHLRREIWTRLEQAGATAVAARISPRPPLAPRKDQGRQGSSPDQRATAVRTPRKGRDSSRRGWGLEDPGRRRFKSIRSEEPQVRASARSCGVPRGTGSGSWLRAQIAAEIANNGAGHFRLSGLRPERPATEHQPDRAACPRNSARTLPGLRLRSRQVATTARVLQAFLASTRAPATGKPGHSDTLA